MEWISASRRPDSAQIPDFWDPRVSEILYVPVEGGEIRVIHYKPERSDLGRPVVFLPGWGAVPHAFRDFFEILYQQVELYYVETREKPSAHIKKWGSNFSMSQKARDVGCVLEFCGLIGTDFILSGGCWGSAVILQGLIDHTFSAPTVAIFDPMHRLQYPYWVLAAAPIIPTWILWLLKPLLKFIKLRRLTERVQKQRATQFVDNAVLWKWKRAAHDVRKFDLFDSVSEIPEEVLIFNGTFDVIHDQRNYPLIARDIPQGRFFFMDIDEGLRERLIGVICKYFAQIAKTEGVPTQILPFERDLHRI